MGSIDALAELAGSLRAFNAERDWGRFHTPKNLAMCLVVEAAELQEPFMWLTGEQSLRPEPERLQAIREEVGDVLICLLNLCDALGIDPVTAAAEKLVRNGEKYPVEQIRGKPGK